MKTTNRFLLVAIFIALVFTFSCSSNGNGDSGDDGGNVPLSSSKAIFSSSSSVLFSSSGIVSSSSSLLGLSSSSNSSVVASSSSEAVFSSSSVLLSSSSIAPSSSSSAVSSSSSVVTNSSSSIQSSIILGPSVSYGGETYQTVVIGSQTWFKRNLNYDVGGSVCYDCAKYGRLYNWATAMSACPSGWHLPSNNEWNALMTVVGGTSWAGTKLKATSDWNGNGNGKDDYGFSALPGGYCTPGGKFFVVGYFGNWWSATEGYGWEMNYSSNSAYSNYTDKSYFYSVRCVQD